MKLKTLKGQWAFTEKGLAKYPTGNPIFALIMVLAISGIGLRRRK